MPIRKPELIVQLDQARPPSDLSPAEFIKIEYAFPYSSGLYSTERPEIVLPKRERQSGESLISFRLSVKKVSDNWKWTVDSNRSSVTDGSNGSAVNLSTAGFDSETTITGTKYIVLQCTINTETLAASSFSLAAVDIGNTDEAEFNMDGEQTKARALIGKINFSGGSPQTATAIQALTWPLRLQYGIINGAPVRLFEAAPINVSDL